MLRPEIPTPYSPGEVAAIFGVDVKTVKRWTKAGRLESFTTLGGHARYRRDFIDALVVTRVAGRVSA